MQVSLTLDQHDFENLATLSLEGAHVVLLMKKRKGAGENFSLSLSLSHAGHSFGRDTVKFLNNAKKKYSIFLESVRY